TAAPPSATAARPAPTTRPTPPTARQPLAPSQLDGGCRRSSPSPNGSYFITKGLLGLAREPPGRPERAPAWGEATVRPTGASRTCRTGRGSVSPVLRGLLRVWGRAPRGGRDTHDVQLGWVLTRARSLGRRAEAAGVPSPRFSG